MLVRIIFLLIILFLGCKTRSRPDEQVNASSASSVQSGSSASENNAQSVTQLNLSSADPSAARSLAALQTEHLDLTTEFKAFQSAVQEYRNSKPYKSPVSDEDHIIGASADLMSELDYSTVKGFVDHKDFVYFDKHGANVDELAQKVQTLSNSSQQLVLNTDPKSEDIFVDTQTWNQRVTNLAKTVDAQSSSNESQKSNGLQLIDTSNPSLLTAGFAFVAVGGWALLHWAKVRFRDPMKNGSTMTEILADWKKNSFQNLLTKDGPALLKVGLALGVGLYILYQADHDHPSPEFGVAHAAELLEIGAVFFGISTIVQLANIWNAIPRNEAGEFAPRKGNWQENFNRFKPWDSFADKNTWEETQLTKTKGVVESTGKAFLYGSITVGLAYWSQNLGLADPDVYKNYSPQQIFISKVSRFYAVCDILSRLGVETLN